MATGRVSLNPATFVQGLMDDVDGEIVEAQFCLWDYGQGGENYLFLGLTIKPMHGDAKAVDQYYSAGDKEYFQPSKDGVNVAEDGVGPFLVPVGDRKSLSGSTNVALFLGSLITAGFPQDRLDSMGINEALVGLKAHFNQVDQPKRKGLIKTGQQGGKEERNKSTLLVSAIIALPGVAVAAKPAGLGTKAATATPATTTAAATTSAATVAAPTNGAASADVEEASMLALYEIIDEQGGQVTKANLPALAFKKMLKHPKKAEVVKLISSTPFLSTAPGISFDGAVIKMQ